MHAVNQEHPTKKRERFVSKYLDPATLIGFTYKKVDFSAYWLSPGSSDGTFVFAVTLNF